MQISKQAVTLNSLSKEIVDTLRSDTFLMRAYTAARKRYPNKRLYTFLPVEGAEGITKGFLMVEGISCEECDLLGKEVCPDYSTEVYGEVGMPMYISPADYLYEGIVDITYIGGVT